MKAVWMALALLTSAVPCFAQDDPVVDPGPVAKPVATDRQLLHKYVWSTLGLDGRYADKTTFSITLMGRRYAGSLRVERSTVCPRPGDSLVTECRG